ncbi:AMP-binding protein [Roseomonas sp. WA12]
MTTSLGAMLRATAQVHAARVAIRDDTGCLTWRDYADRIARTAGAFRLHGLRPGQRFGILARNSVAQALLINAGYWGGMVPFPVNRRSPASFSRPRHDPPPPVLE